MKKVILFIGVMLLSFSLVACKQKNNVADVVEDHEELPDFKKEEIEKAKNTVKENFDFEGCTLKKVWYDEEKSKYVIGAYLETGKGSINGVEPENVIVVFTEFDVDSAGGDRSFEPNSTYTDWQFILIRDDKEDDWEIDTWGY